MMVARWSGAGVPHRRRSCGIDELTATHAPASSRGRAMSDGVRKVHARGPARPALAPLADEAAPVLPATEPADGARRAAAGLIVGDDSLAGGSP